MISTSAYAESALRVTCHGSNEGAMIYLNGEPKGSCSVDLFVPSGEMTLRAVKKVDNEHERVFEKTFFLADDSAKKIDVNLSRSQLTPAAKQQRLAAKLRKEQRRAQDALADAEQGDIQAMYSLSRYYRNGQGVTRNSEKAQFWRDKAVETERQNVAMATLKSAQAGNLESMEEIAHLYKKGRGVEQSDELAQMWIDKKTATIKAKEEQHAQKVLASAEHGDVNAMREMSELYKTGKGVDQSDKKSQRWSKRRQSALAKKAKKERKARELAQAKRELDEINYFGNVKEMGTSIANNTHNEEPITLTLGGATGMLAATVGDIISAPFRLTNQLFLQREISAQAAVWDAPKSMVAKAHQQKSQQDTTLLASVK